MRVTLCKILITTVTCQNKTPYWCRNKTLSGGLYRQQWKVFDFVWLQSKLQPFLLSFYELSYVVWPRTDGGTDELSEEGKSGNKTPFGQNRQLGGGRRVLFWHITVVGENGFSHFHKKKILIELRMTYV